MSDSPTTDTIVALNASRERTASTHSGYGMLVLLLLIILVQIWAIRQLVIDNHTVLTITAVIVAPLALIFVASGFYMLQPNQAAAITLFGDYKGTDRSTGLRWVLP